MIIRSNPIRAIVAVLSLCLCIASASCSEKSQSQPPNESATQEPGSEATFAPEDSGATNALDGKRYEATVNNLEHGYQYTLPVEFSGDQAFICFHNGGYLDLSLDDPTIPDEHDIQATDDEKSQTWTIDILDSSSDLGEATPARPCTGAQ